ncbi:MAG TPA: septal ring lytic transglycosylase RlpA family protein [Terriglobia bacterium]
MSWSRISFIASIGVISLLAASCGKKAAAPSQSEVGVASWYGQPFDGRPTASGEIYDMEKMTAAHRTYPFGTIIRVSSLVSSKTAEVRINDRGPFVQGRIIDLSHAGAQAIGMESVANVRLDVISMPATRGVDVFAVQIGAFADRAQAEQLRAQMEHEYGTASLVLRPGDQTWRVLVGLEATPENANTLAEKLDKEAGPAFVVRVDSEQ